MIKNKCKLCFKSINLKSFLFKIILKEHPGVVGINLNVKHPVNVLRSTMLVMEYLNAVMAVMKLLNWLVQLLQVKLLNQ